MTIPRTATAVVTAVLGLALLQAGAGAAREAGGASLDEIGVVRGDTLRVTRDGVIAAALKHNEMLAASEAMRDAAGADALGAWRGFLPRVTLGAYRMRTDDALYGFGFKLNQRRATQADFAAPPAPVNTLNYPGIGENNIMQVRVQQPVFNGGMAIYGKRAADAMSRAAKLEHARAAETVRFNAVQAYEGLVLAKAYETVMEAAIASADGHVRQAEAMVANEMATEADLLQARVYRDGLRQKLIEVRNMVDEAGRNILLLTALDTELPLAPDTAAAGAAASAPEPGRAEDRADIAAARAQAAAARNMSRAARGAMLPHLNLQAEKNWFHHDDLFGNEANSWTVGIYATWDLFAGLENVGALRKARAQSRAAEHMADFKLRQARTEQKLAAQALGAAEDKQRVANDAVASGRESLRIITDMYREGLASMVDLLDVQAAATAAEGNLVQARHDVKVGEAKLIYAGAIDPDAEEDGRP